MSTKFHKPKHQLIELAPLPFRVHDEQRQYQSRNGQWYPSITSFLSSVLNESGLDKWRARVGDAAADAAQSRGARRGTIVHRLLESHLFGQTIDTKPIMPIHLDLFEQVKSLLDGHLTDVYLFEKALYSDWWQLAGTPDLIGLWDGILSVIDFKTATRRKQESHVQKHFLQTAGYKLLFDDTMHVPTHPEYEVKQLVIIVANEEGPPPQVFVEPAGDYMKMFERLWWDKHPAAAHHTTLGPEHAEIYAELQTILNR